MNERQMTFIGIALLVGALGCTAENPNIDTESVNEAAPSALPESLVPGEKMIPWEAQAETAPLPEGFAIERRSLFQLDTTTPEERFDVRGNSRWKLAGTLADRMGRRSLSLITPAGTEAITEGGWYLPPAGAMNPSGDLMVCYNLLTGKTSQITEGMMPDPRKGVKAFCRLRTTTGWQREFEVGDRTRIGNWIRSITALNDGSFRVEYLADDGLLFDPAAKHLIKTQTLVDGKITGERLVRPGLDARR